MNPLGVYLEGLAQSQALGTAELSAYPHLQALVNEVGKGLRPRVSYTSHPRGLRNDKPDGGLFTLYKDRGTLLDDGELPYPDRGAVEVKGMSHSITALSKSAQVGRYLHSCGHVLVTNLYQFRLLRDGDEEPIESFDLAPNPVEALALRHSKHFLQERWHDLEEFLKRVLTAKVPLDEPRIVALQIASHAKDALRHLKSIPETALDHLRIPLENTGVTFKGDGEESSLRSLIVQTLVYGLFAAFCDWRLTASDKSQFNWRTSAHHLPVPAFEALFTALSGKSDLASAGLSPYLDRVEEVLNRIERNSFFQAFGKSGAIIYFYEPFLAEYDPVLRKRMGVWYTPIEVVKFMVHQADAMVRQKLKKPLGLADPSVRLLDPCCGTGAFLVEAIDLIAERLGGQNSATVGLELAEAVRSRLCGMEILPGSFIIAHMLVGQRLAHYGGRLEPGEKAKILYTNALSRHYEELDDTEKLAEDYIPLRLRQESHEAEALKREGKIDVVIGNPPYNGYADMATVPQEKQLVARFAPEDGERGGQGLNDLYVRFFAMADRLIRDRTGRGVICFVSNSSWLQARSHQTMRGSLLGGYDEIRLDNLNGDKRATGKLTPEGLPDPSIFSTEFNREGIQVGTAVTTLVRSAEPFVGIRGLVLYRDWWGTNKRADLVRDLKNVFDQARYMNVIADARLGYVLRPNRVHEAYSRWPRLNEIIPNSFSGVKTSRDDLVVGTDLGQLTLQIKNYFNPTVSLEEIARQSPSASRSSSRFDPVATRSTLQSRGINSAGFRSFLYRPFDVRWIYWESETDLIDRKRADSISHFDYLNPTLFACQINRKNYDPPAFGTVLGGLHVIERGASAFPQWLTADDESQSALVAGFERTRHLNLSDDALKYAGRIDLDPQDLFYHCLALLHAPSYAREFGDALAQDWPRVRLPGFYAREEIDDRVVCDRVRRSALVGRRLSDLLDPLIPLSSSENSKLANVARLCKKGGGQIQVEDLKVNVRWGQRGKENAIMPGRGLVVDRHALPVLASQRSLDFDEEEPLDFSDDLNVYLNADVFFSGVPRRVWHYSLGGYSVLKKWLSYRETVVLGRELTMTDVKTFQTIARKITLILKMERELDDNLYSVMEVANPVLVESS